MKLIIQGERIAATATDDYQGDEFTLAAPQDFAPQYLDDYRYANGALSTLSEVIWSRIKSLRDRKTQQGGYQVGGEWYHSDVFSRTQQIGLTLMGANIPQGLLWKTMGGTFVTMTPTLAQQIFVAAGQQDAALFGYAEQLRAQVIASQNPVSIDIEAGWPATFGGI